jgi:PD-(D/E)XK nuclease superfamily protein
MKETKNSLQSRPNSRRQSKCRGQAVEAIHPNHRAQLLTHLRLTNKHSGLLINFHTVLIKDSYQRVVNNLPEQP